MQFQELSLAGVSSDDEDITSQLLSMLAEEMSSNAKKRKRSAAARQAAAAAAAAAPSSPPSSGDSAHSASPTSTSLSSPRALTRPRLAASSSDEVKKEKNRNSVKRSYYRKLETLDELRKHADHLRQQYHRLFAQWEEKTEREKAESAKEPSSLMKRYVELSRQRDRLWLENQALQDAFEEREKISFRFQRLFDVNYQLMDHSIAAPASQEVQVQTPMIVMDEMSFEAFTRFAHDAQQTFEAFVASRNSMITTDTALGWTCSHVAKDNSFGYYFEKHFSANRYASVDDVVLTAWETLTSPDRHSKLYAPALHTRFHIMQIFDENSYVLFRTMEKEGEDSITTALIIMTRIPHESTGGCLVICKGLKREEHTLRVEDAAALSLRKKQEWRQSMYWLNVEELAGDGSGEGKTLKVVHGGIMNNMGDRSRSFWLFENLQIALRWEQNLGLGEPLS